MRIEVSGQLILKRDQEGLYLRGDMQALGGRYNIYGNKFHVVDGSLNFSTASRPAVHLNAYTTRRGSSGLERRIHLNLSWPQDQKEPTISLSYDEPGYLEEDLWRMLGGSTIGAGLAINQLERVLNERMQNIDIEIDQSQSAKTVGPGAGSNDADPERDMVIGIGRYLWEDVYVRYRQGLKVDSERQVQVEYRLSNLFLLRSEFIRNSRRRWSSENAQYTDEFNFDVKFRWEY
jgi:hypothetical protein